MAINDEQLHLRYIFTNFVTHEQIHDETIRRIPSFMIRFGVDIMTEYEENAFNREKRMKKLVWPIQYGKCSCEEA